MYQKRTRNTLDKNWKSTQKALGKYQKVTRAHDEDFVLRHIEDLHDCVASELACFEDLRKLIIDKLYTYTIVALKRVPGWYNDSYCVWFQFVEM